MNFPRITINPYQMNGMPCIRGLRIPVATIVAMVAEGMNDAEILGNRGTQHSIHGELSRNRCCVLLIPSTISLTYKTVFHILDWCKCKFLSIRITPQMSGG